MAVRLDGNKVINMPLDNDSDSCRESAVIRIQRLVKIKQRELDGLELLLKIAERAEVGSPLEELLWEMTSQWGTGNQMGYR